MKFRTVEEKFFRMAPDDGAGSGGGSPLMPAGDGGALPGSTTPGEGGSTLPTSSGSAEATELAAALKKSAGEWGARERERVAPSKDEKTPPDPSRGTPLHEALANADQVPGGKPPETAAPGDGKAPEGGKPPEGTKPPEGGKTPEGEAAANAGQPVEIKLTHDGQEFTEPEIKNALDYAKAAYQFFTTGEGAKFKEQAEALKVKEAEINERLQGPDMVILDTLSKYPDLREDFLKMATERYPELGGQYDHVRTQDTIKGLQAKIEALEKQVGGTTKKIEDKDAAEKARIADEQRSAAINDFTTKVRDHATARMKELNIPERFGTMAEKAAATAINTREIPATVEAVNKFMDEFFNDLVGERSSAEARGRQGYVDAKRGLPPPPPTGGTPPRITGEKPKTFEECGRNLNRRLEVMGGNT
jgi:hypothetical protein